MVDKCNRAKTRCHCSQRYTGKHRSTGAIAHGIGGLLPQALAQANTGGAKRIIQTHLLVSAAAGQANSFGNVSLGGGSTVEIALASPIAAAIPVLRKPGIPPGTPIWLKTTIEI